DDLERFADALDLRVVPGLFSAEVPDELGTPLTVHVLRLGLQRLVGQVELGLTWVAPDGTESRARTEPFPADAFDAEVPAYLRAPRGPPGMWSLVPELRRGTTAARGAAVPVWCLPGPPGDAPEGKGVDELRTRGERSLVPPGGPEDATVPASR